MKHIKHLFFDLDHTLWDFEKNSELTFKRIFEEQHISIHFKDFIKVYSPINIRYWKLYRENEITKENLRYKRLKDTFDILNFSITDGLIHEISEAYIQYLPYFNHLFLGAEDILSYLKDKYSLHIITNGFEEVQKIKMDTSKISKYFDVIVTSESVGVKKPNPKVFEFALAQAKATPKESLMIGDSYEADILGALNVGMEAIHFAEIDSDTNGVLRIKNLEELKQYL
ncbi:YjjG family noncanonical pyrimidine nucleotidase [Tenacibaculum sp. SG-28]|uniref:YjjG family noncanonical pyrimidine nucleotidase n=1 Tax=Tenacibaculum sp. SG-28 TaxID=754426 RepID=UPI000CF4A1D8|nr:YjjG family noncanonical pyrimidine nucleotidase [Tenacibaculum sp. SG-28]PQJ22979.1 noncanonical pyrimidine nucleotidase, YjjG family [Tenacibaculum sp. SG-28]